MFVKKYYQFKYQLNSLDSQKEYWWIDHYGEYEASNNGYVEGREDFLETIKAEVCEATFSYFPELKAKEEILRPVCEKIIAGNTAHCLYEQLFDLILGFYEKKEFKKEIINWNYAKISTDEEIEKEVQDFIKSCNVSPDSFEYVRRMIYNTAKNENHYNYYEQVLHKAILRSVTKIFKEIPELSPDLIRYINSASLGTMIILHSELFEAIANDTVRPFND